MVSKDEEIEKLKSEIERLKKELKKRKKYGLVWEDKKEDVVEMCKKKLPIIKEVKSREIITDKNKPINLLIEGDNYHSLSVLNYTHAGKIDVIYIDPPYNTGNKDFIFNDNYVDLEDGYRHSKWLSFMEKRLKLARNLLKETGVIFVSIDDNEVAQLKLLMDEIFGEKNFIINLCWKSRHSISNDAIVSTNHNYILVYAKNIEKIKIPEMFRMLPDEEYTKDFSNPDNDPNGPWKAVHLEISGVHISKGLIYEIYDEKNKIRYYPDKNKCWRFSKEKFNELLRQGRIIFYGDPKKKPRYKFYLKEALITPSSWLDNVGTTTDGTRELFDIFHEKVFNNPKPKSLIKYLIKMYSRKKDLIILDFMAGSGTTGHAVLELNKEDGGNRQFILCTNNENNICTDVCYPRIKKVIEGYKNSKGEWVEGLGGNLKYFKTDFVDYEEPTDKNKTKFAKHVTEMVCVKEGTYEKVMDNEKFVIFKNSNHYTAIIWDQTAISEFKNAIKDMQGEFSVYIFSLTDDTFDEEFKDVKQKVTLSPIPEAILKVYRRIFR
jgi:adenine-specific DNA-methyltransferase